MEKIHNITYIHTHIHAYIHTYTHTYTHIHIHIHIHIHTYTYTYTYIHTHIHTMVMRKLWVTDHCFSMSWAEFQLGLKVLFFSCGDSHSLLYQAWLGLSFSEWHCQNILPAGQLVEHLSVVKVQTYSGKEAALGVGGVSTPARRVWAASLRKTWALRMPWEWVSGYVEFIYEPMKLRALSSSTLLQWII